MENITTEEFVKLLWQEFSRRIRQEANREEGAFWDLEDARRHGLVEMQDLLEAKEPIRRSSAARILHEFLLRELGEPDLADISAAGVLRDLYDCHVCVNHVAQVYCKGIMPAFREGVFGMREGVTRKEALSMMHGLFSKKRRCLKSLGQAEKGDPASDCLEKNKEGASCEGRAIRLSYDEAKAFLRMHPNVIHLDVRTPWEYGNRHPQGAENLPLLQLLEEPKKAGKFRKETGKADLPFDQPVVIGCDGGYRSEMAADCLVKAGFLEVYHYGWG